MRYFCEDDEIGNSSLTHSLFVLRTNLVIGKTPHYPLSLPTLLRVEGGDSRHSLKIFCNPYTWFLQHQPSLHNCGFRRIAQSFRAFVVDNR